ncbi:MAG: tolB, partial [Chthonomonadales bacterium]|nr:tolB [Chthonomonadales bacterium]
MSLTRRFHIVFLAALLTLSALAAQSQSAPPHGRFYFGAGNTDYNSVIFESNLDSSNTIALTGYHNFYSMNYPTVSRDGSLIAFASNQNPSNNYHVWVMNADGSNRRELTGPDLVEHFYDKDLYPAISPDGTKIAFSSNRAVEFDGNHYTELYVINTDGTNLRQLTTSNPTLGPNTRNSINEVAWGPDSQTILFRGTVPWTEAGDFSAKEGIYMIHSDGSGLQQIVGGYHVGFHTTFAIDWSH